MSNTVRIRTTPNGSDKYVKVNLEQDFDFVEILSLKISQEDTYRKFCSDYGVIVGRVSINNGFGVPNAKVSVFIPLDEVDKQDPIIKGLYPFEVISDKDSDGIRYNLLPKQSSSDNECYTAVGTFPTKREILDNDTMLEVYCKYYKFTTTTNHAGDFMLFGVPLGSHVVHVDADISDIGIASQRPYDFISQGTPNKLFESPTKFKSSKNLNKLIQVKTLNSGVNVQPFWGDIENCQIGITRIDFDLNTNIVPSAIFMGSIYGDQHKHSINKRCRPRRKLGMVCEQVTGTGTIDMIRKTIDGQIEDFTVEGGQLIDENGAWAFQVPMNLDYMVTAEDGTLIFSEDPNIGLPTRARVRFNIGMDETGGEGRIRTRARYLVPNNPQNAAEDDYNFGPDTKDTSFKDMYWNKIYTVSNFISRFQKYLTINRVGSRNITGMKSVDECAGDKTPYPYNKVDTDLNPIFFIICLIITIIGFIIYMINAIILPIVNFLISAINSMMNAIVSVVCGIIDAINSVSDILGLTLTCGLSWTNISPIGCITVTCPAEDGDAYAPGCVSSSDGYSAAPVTPVYYPGDSFGHGTNFGNLVGLNDCFAFEMAKALNLFHFDFYNDWINGTLFGFLLKYKKKKNKREVFCEYECEGSGTFTPSDGIDGNNNGNGDNNCHDNLLLDTCYISNDDKSHKEARDSNIIRDGLIKKYNGEFYYAATTHFPPNSGPHFKLFATDIIDLGSVFNCDWQGIPRVQKLLIPTTYKIPPDTQELADDDTTVETCGMVGLGGTISGEFFSIDCIGLHVDDRQCLNLRHICEMGVDIDQAVEDAAGNIITPSDCVIGINDIDDDDGKWFRDVFTALNSGTTTPTSINIGGLTTDFNLSNAPVYNFASDTDNGKDYTEFRGYPLNDDNNFSQPKHSYYFYFGLLPGKTALDKMNNKFFTPCSQVVTEDILISASTTITSGSSGTITFTFIGGSAPFTWTVTGTIYGPPTSSYGPVSGSGTGGYLTGLSAGTYTITGIDTLGNPVSTTVIVSAQPALYASVGKSSDSTTTTSNDGSITISSVGGGTPPYQFELRNAAGGIVGTYSMQTLVTPKVLTGLAVDNITGYKVTIQDSVPNTLIFSGITIGGPNPLQLSATSVNASCYGQNNASINLTSSGGLPPKTYSTTGPAGFSSSSPIMTALIAGTYVTTLTDGAAASTSVTTIITQPPQLVILPAVASEVNKQCDPNYHFVPFHIDGTTSGISAGVVDVEYSLDGGTWQYSAMTYINTVTPMVITVPNGSIATNIRIRFSALQGAYTCYSNVLNIPLAQIALPPNFLTISLGTVPPNCAIGTSKFNLNISHNVRAPYTIDYNIGSGALVGSVTTSSLTTLMNIPSIPSSNKYPNQISIVVKVTDSKGCVSPSILLTSPTMLQQVPATALSCVVYSTLMLSGPHIGEWEHVIVGSGGIAPYSGTTTVYDLNPTYTALITDSNGCTATATG